MRRRLIHGYAEVRLDVVWAVVRDRLRPLLAALEFMVGGMANLAFQHIGQQYFDAAHLLAETIKSGECHDYELANPVLFLYRHFIELFLKAALGHAAKT